MTRKFTLFDVPRPIGTSDDTALSVIPAFAIPTTIEAIERRKYRSFWPTDEDFARAYQVLSRMQWNLLMDATDRIVSEIRALRQGDNTPLAAQDPLLDPYTLDLIALEDIVGSLSTNGKSAAFILEEIRTLQEAANAGDAESQAELLRIGAIIAGAV